MKYPPWPHLYRLAKLELQRVLETLPDEIRERALEVPVVYELAPTPEICEDGIEPDTLGLFVGDAFSSLDSPTPLPPQILLFLENIWDFAEGDATAYKEEVRITYLHELGHFLGLDEDDLTSRGLE